MNEGAWLRTAPSKSTRENPELDSAWLDFDIETDPMFSEADITAFLVPRLERAVPGRVIALYVYGSFARGALRPDTDLDVAFLHERAFDPVLVFKIAQRLASVVHRDVDLIDLRSATIVLRAQVVGEGRAIYVGEENEHGLFEMHTLSMYARFNEERREVLESFAARYRG